MFRKCMEGMYVKVGEHETGRDRLPGPDFHDDESARLVLQRGDCPRPWT
jgi:hypothetical protein